MIAWASGLGMVVGRFSRPLRGVGVGRFSRPLRAVGVLAMPDAGLDTI